MAVEREEDTRVVTRAVGMGPQVLARVTDRVRALQQVEHPGVLVPCGVGVAEGDQVIVTSPWVDGVDLAELETRRGPLTAGECVWLGTKVAAALEKLHSRGVAHGDIAPANVVIAYGDVILVDTVGGCLPDELGTAGFRAPERAEGATFAGDAYSLGALLRWCAAASDSVPIEAWTAPLVVADPAARPPVQVAARALASCASPRPVAVPPRSEVVSAVRARAGVRTERIAAGRPWRVKRVVLRAAAALAVIVAGVSVVIAVPRAVDAAIPGPSAGSGVEPEVAVTSIDAELLAASAPDPADAAAELTRQRVAALSDGDGAALLAVVGDGPVTEETSVLAEQLDSGLVRYDGLDVEVLEVEVVEHTDSAAIVEVHYVVTDHHIDAQEGTADVPGYDQRVELELTWDGRWTVERVLPLP